MLASLQAATSSRNAVVLPAAGQTAQAGDAVTGAQDMINRPALIFAQPVGRPVTGMQWRDGIAARIDRLNQIQFRRQNLLAWKIHVRF